VAELPFSYLHFDHLAAIEAWYAKYQRDPKSIDPTWCYFFDGLTLGGKSAGEDKGCLSLAVIDAYRRYGYLKAKINPLKEPSSPEQLKWIIDCAQDEIPSHGLLTASTVPLQALVQKLESSYCSSLSVEYMHCSPEIQVWIQNRVEGHLKAFQAEEKLRMFKILYQAQLMEAYLHTKYMGQKRFSLEGAESLMAMLGELVEASGAQGVEEFVIGMSHRGRLNVMAHILKRAYSKIFAEFEGRDESVDMAGDVKYHKGESSDLITTYGYKVHVTLTANPSHLESVGAVVQGRTYAKQETAHDKERRRVVPLIMHGEASMAGQGIVYEIMQMGQLEGYGVGGTLHIVIDNQVGFTAVAQEYRSMQYSTDIGRAFGSPIFHLNADDPEACVRAMLMALELRQTLHCDVLLNLLCYRRYGHNEADEPVFTQPEIYQVIRQRVSVTDAYQQRLLQEGVLESSYVEPLTREYQEILDQEFERVQKQKEGNIQEAFQGVWKDYEPVSENNWDDAIATGVSRDQLLRYAHDLSQSPKNFTLHPKLQRLFTERLQRLESQMDWAFAEQLAFASLLCEGTPIRLSGQDSCRGTFTQRHAVWIDQTTGEQYVPLSHLQLQQGHFEVRNSAVSELGVLGFEFGYSLDAPGTLVLWEAQFGDFANGAQILIDQYVAASAQKWKRYSGLVLLLPHGYEGQGAEHSSARLERYLQLCAQYNLQVCYPTTPAQYFHLLRRQVKRRTRWPLVIMSPKELLRHHACISSLDDLIKGSFQDILCEEHPTAEHIVCCTGHIYYELLSERTKRGLQDIAYVRIEQLYPINAQKLQNCLAQYPKAKRISWVQEEPLNMGAAATLVPLLQTACQKSVRVVARKASAATATGLYSQHKKEHAELMDQVFT